MDFNVEKERCVFAKTGFGDSEYKCDLLSEECNGLKQTKICKFYKTKEEFDAANDRAIELCRDKHLCGDCKYRKKACLKSTEGKSSAVL